MPQKLIPNQHTINSKQFLRALNDRILVPTGKMCIHFSNNRPKQFHLFPENEVKKKRLSSRKIFKNVQIIFTKISHYTDKQILKTTIYSFILTYCLLIFFYERILSDKIYLYICNNLTTINSLLHKIKSRQNTIKTVYCINKSECKN